MRKTLLLAAIVAAAPFAVSANDLSYTYVEGGYAKLHMDDSQFNDPEGDGGYIRGSFAIAEQVHLFGGFGRVSDDFTVNALDIGAGVDIDVNVDAEIRSAEFGIGYHMPFTERLDFTADLAYLRQEYKVTASIAGVSDSDKVDAKGGRATLGLRGKPSPRTEAWIKAGYIDGGDFEGDFVGNLGGQIKFSKTWGLVGEVEVIEDSTRYLVGVRASF
jgi:hypothetical protein